MASGWIPVPERDVVMKWMPYGPHAILIRFAGEVGDEAFERGRALVRALEEHPPRGLVEFVPAFTTILLEFDPAALFDPMVEGDALVERLRRAVKHLPEEAPLKEVPVVYDGLDLARVAEVHGLSVEEVVLRHVAPIYKVYMLGFAPGFPYLGDLDPMLHTPRLATPRKRVPAGAVAIGGEHTGIYSVERPGGWNLIGRTGVRLFDPGRVIQAGGEERAFYLQAGDRVRFVRVNSLEEAVTES